MIPEGSKVFMKLRVAPPESKHSVVYNGISANDWLCPGGISSKQKNDLSSVSIETLSKRPHTAHSILVIKQNPQYRGLEKYETLTGNSYNTGSGSQTSDSTSIRPPTSTKRPMTAFSSRNLKKGIALATHYNIASNNSKNPDLDLTIQSSHCKEVQSRKLCWNDTREARKVEPTRETCDTIEGIRKSYQTRAQSAPACVNRTRTQTTDHRTKTNLYWRAKSAYHRRNMYKEESTEDSNRYKTNYQHQDQHGSLLRPLLFSSEDVIKHSAGCPYKCKGCFKACLVSQDYLNRSQEATQASWRKQRRIKRGPGFAVEFALAKSQPLYQLLHKHKHGGIKPSEDNQTTSVEINGTETDNKTISNENHVERNHRLDERPMNTKLCQQSEKDPCRYSEKDQSKPSEKNQQIEDIKSSEIDPCKLRQHDEGKVTQQARSAPTKMVNHDSRSTSKDQCTPTKICQRKPNDTC